MVYPHRRPDLFLSHPPLLLPHQHQNDETQKEGQGDPQNPRRCVGWLAPLQVSLQLVQMLSMPLASHFVPLLAHASVHRWSPPRFPFVVARSRSAGRDREDRHFLLTQKTCFLHTITSGLPLCQKGHTAYPRPFTQQSPVVPLIASSDDGKHEAVGINTR